MFVFFVLIWFYKASNSVTYLVITVNTICICDEDLSFLLLLLVFSVSGVCLSLYVLFILIGCAGSVGFLWRAGSYISCVCDSAVWSGGPVQLYLAFSVGADGGTVRIFFFSGSVVAGTVQFKW